MDHTRFRSSAGDVYTLFHTHEAHAGVLTRPGKVGRKYRSGPEPALAHCSSLTCWERHCEWYEGGALSLADWITDRAADLREYGYAKVVDNPRARV